MVRHARFALPTEPLLDESTAVLRMKRPSESAARWLAEVAQEPDLVGRARTLWTDIRRRLEGPGLEALLEGVLIQSVRGRREGIAALSALLASQSSGDVLLEQAGEFRHLHRMVLRLRMLERRGEALTESEQRLLRGLAARDGALQSDPASMLLEFDPSASVRDRGPAGECRRAFGALIAKIEVAAALEPSSLAEFLRLARLELDAAELRAARLAGRIDPSVAAQVSRTMPMLGGIDEDVRDLRAFLARLEESRRLALLHEHVLLMRDHLSAEQEALFVARLESCAELQLLRRLLRSLERSPMSTRTLGRFVERLLATGDVLNRLGLRGRELDVVEAALIVLDFHRDGALVIPAGDPVLDALGAHGLAGVQRREGALRVGLGPSLGRPDPLPLGLPVPAPGDEEESSSSRREDRSVKKLLATHVNNSGIMLGLFRNPKVVSTPGAVAFVAQRTRSLRVLEAIAENRRLYSGQANRDVPLLLLKSPLPLPIKSLRRFINVRYVSKIDLRRLAADRSAIRREVGDEIVRYLRTLG
jgi:hypothetical protein